MPTLYVICTHFDKSEILQLMLDVAGLYLTTEDLDACQHQLMTLLKNDKENDAATIVSKQVYLSLLFLK